MCNFRILYTWDWRLYFLNVLGFAYPRVQMEITTAVTVAWELQHHFSVLPQKNLQCLHQGSQRPSCVPGVWHVCVPERPVLQAAELLWMCAGKHVVGGKASLGDDGVQWNHISSSSRLWVQ